MAWQCSQWVYPSVHTHAPVHCPASTVKPVSRNIKLFSQVRNAVSMALKMLGIQGEATGKIVWSIKSLSIGEIDVEFEGDDE